VVVLWTETSIRSDWVKDEAGAARNKGLLLQVLAGEVVPPMGFRQLQAAQLRGWTGEPHPERDKLVRAVRLIVGASDASEREAQGAEATAMGQAAEEEEGRAAEEKKRRAAAEEQRRAADEEQRQAADEEKHRAAEEEGRRIAEEARRRAAEEKRQAAEKVAREAQEERKGRAEGRKARPQAAREIEEDRKPRSGGSDYQTLVAPSEATRQANQKRVTRRPRRGQSGPEEDSPGARIAASSLSSFELRLAGVAGFGALVGMYGSYRALALYDSSVRLEAVDGVFFWGCLLAGGLLGLKKVARLSAGQIASTVGLTLAGLSLWNLLGSLLPITSAESPAAAALLAAWPWFFPARGGLQMGGMTAGLLLATRPDLGPQRTLLVSAGIAIATWLSGSVILVLFGLSQIGVGDAFFYVWVGLPFWPLVSAVVSYGLQSRLSLTHREIGGLVGWTLLGSSLGSLALFVLSRVLTNFLPTLFSVFSAQAAVQYAAVFGMLAHGIRRLSRERAESAELA
jgi:hypothetical protein